MIVKVPVAIGTSPNIFDASFTAFAVQIGSAYVFFTATCRGLDLRVAREVWR